MHATKSHEKAFSRLRSMLSIVVIALALAGCSADLTTIKAFGDTFDVGQSGKVLARELKSRGWAGDTPETYGFVVAGEHAGDDLRARLAKMGFEPFGDPERTPEAYWSFTDTDGENYLAKVQDLQPGDTAPIRGDDGLLVEVARDSAAIVFSR